MDTTGDASGGTGLCGGDHRRRCARRRNGDRAGGLRDALGAGPLAARAGRDRPHRRTTVTGSVDVRGRYRGTFGPVSAYLQVSQNATQIGPNVPLSLGDRSGNVFPIFGGLDTRLLADGAYVFNLVVVTACGNATTEVPVLVDNVDPSLSFTSGPASGSVIPYGSTVSFKFSAVDATSQISYQCAYDTAALNACTSPTPAHHIVTGSPWLPVVGTDALGNSSTIQRVFRVGAQPRCRVPASARADARPGARQAASRALHGSARSAGRRGPS